MKRSAASNGGGDALDTPAGGVHVLPGPGNPVAIATGRGVVLVGAGPGGEPTRRMLTALRRISEAPISHLVYGSGELRTCLGAGDILAHAAGRGDPRPLLVGHAAVRERFVHAGETAGLRPLLDAPDGDAPASTPAPGKPVMPDIAFDERLVIDGGTRVIELLAAPSASEDTLAVWVGDVHFLHAGSALGGSVPDAGSPRRALGDPMRWAHSMERLFALSPRVLLGASGPALHDPDDIADAMLSPVAVIRWLRAAVVERMNAGMHIDDIVHALRLPAQLTHRRGTRAGGGDPAYLMRAIWHTENGWWDRNPTTLHPSAPSVTAADLRDAIAPTQDDARRVLARARAHADAGETQLALHVVDLIALLDDDAPGVREARALKADLAGMRPAGAGTC